MANDTREWQLTVRTGPEPKAEPEKKSWLARTVSHPLGIPIVAGVLAIVSGSLVSIVTGWQSRILERQKADYARITQMINSTNPDTVADNLSFLIQAKLISDSDIRQGLADYLATREVGSGPTAAASGPDFTASLTLKTDNPFRNVVSVVSQDETGGIVCAAALMADHRIVLPTYCLGDSDTPSESNVSIAVIDMQGNRAAVDPKGAITRAVSVDGQDYSVTILSMGEDAARFGSGFSSTPFSGSSGTQLSVIQFVPPARGTSGGTLSVVAGEQCAIRQIRPESVSTKCDVIRAATGSPVFDAQTGVLIGLYYARNVDWVDDLVLRYDYLLSQDETGP